VSFLVLSVSGGASSVGTRVPTEASVVFASAYVSVSGVVVTTWDKTLNFPLPAAIIGFGTEATCTHE
jgi:hypothetical protein